MAARPRVNAPVGSQRWVLDERQQIDQFIEQEIEDFTYLARNEMEWLNEHMAEVFSQTQFDVAEVFKTPGKLRGKTPRTARKFNALEARAPLTDVFASNLQQTSPTRSVHSVKQNINFYVAEDKENPEPQTYSPTRYSLDAGKENVDSGYHDMTENDEMNIDRQEMHTIRQSPAKSPIFKVITKPTPLRLQTMKEEGLRTQRESTGSFVSAKEVPSRSGTSEEPEKNASKEQPHVEEEPSAPASRAVIPEVLTARAENQFSISAETENAFDAALDEAEQESPVQQQDQLGGNDTTSETSSPERPTIRKKSSLTFASLPAREPLGTKKSLGAPQSRASHTDLTRPVNTARNSQFSKFVGTKSPSRIQKVSDDHETKESETKEIPPADEDDMGVSTTTSATKLHSKFSTQSLHDRIALLGKSNSAQLSKQKSSGLPGALGAGTSSQNAQLEVHASKGDDNEDSWIEPITLPQSDETTKQSLLKVAETMPDSVRPSEPVTLIGETKSETSSKHTTTRTIEETEAKELPAPTQDKQDLTEVDNISYPNLTTLNTESTTPAGSPVALKHGDGPLSASKARLYSVFKSAKNIFASSAGISAQAKMETLSPKPSRTNTDMAHTPLAEVFSQRADDQAPPPNPPASYISPQKLSTEGKKPQENADANEARPPRRSSQRQQQARMDQESEVKEQVRVVEAAPNDAYAVARDSQLPSEGPKSSLQANSKVTKQKNVQENESDMPPPPPPKSSSRLQNPGEAKRPPKPSKESFAKVKPAPVSIRVPSLAAQKAGYMQQNSAMTIPSQESTAPPPPPKQPTLTKKGSNSSLKSATSSARPKALEAAARKKEQDEREAQRKAEQKRELERRRAARQEEEKRAQEQKAAEEKRIHEAKLAAQKQAAEQRKIEAARKAEFQRSQASASQSKAIDDDPPLDRSTFGQSNLVKADLNASRPVSRDISRPPMPHVNPAKPPPKRQMQAEEDDQFQFSRVQKPGVATANNAAKRRRTSEEPLSPEQPQQRPTMAPPIRRSNMTKDTAIKHTHGFMYPGTSHAGPSMHKTAIANQQNAQHPKTPHMNDLATYHQGRIPFAENSNPQGSQRPGSQPLNRSQGPHHNKTPGSSKTPKHASSPHYANGDNIELPEIATDSEDSDDGGDNDFVAPDWADSPALRELLRQQQLVDPFKVFGPIAPLVMEEVFKGNKDRHAKFRNRTSSANWNGPDRLTEEERRRDWEAREKFEKEGGWTYGAGFNPGPGR